jgi:endonuclease/exonuclease/phosphatase family metal-dependent hydrolase
MLLVSRPVRGLACPSPVDRSGGAFGTRRTVGRRARYLQQSRVLAAQWLRHDTATRGVEALLEPTYYRWLRGEHPFHIDHVFVPGAWTSHLSMTVGVYHEWVATRRSDHVPLLVDINMSETAVTGQSAS